MLVTRLMKRLAKICGKWFWFSGLTAVTASAQPAEPAISDFSAGPLIQRFSLTLAKGERLEAMGPLFSTQTRDTQQQVAVPPLFSHLSDKDTDSTSFDFLYPLLTYDRYGGQYRWQLIQLLSFAGSENPDDSLEKRFTLFPFIFTQRSTDPEHNYAAVLPFYGHIENRLFRSEIDFALWPLYVKTVRHRPVGVPPGEPLTEGSNHYLHPRQGEITTYNYLYPIFHLRYGDGLRGWQVWPLTGHEHKEITYKTNSWGDEELVPGHDTRFVLWPFYFHLTNGIGTDNPMRRTMFLPFYVQTRSPERDSTSYIWPFGVNITDDRAQQYHEVDAPWPLVVFARGEGKHTSRVWPLFSRASNTNQESDFYLWPLYKYKRLHSGPLDRERTRILFYLFSQVNEKNTETGAVRKRTDLWPLFTRHQEFDGTSRFQFLALIESMLPNNPSVERNWSPVWSLWRSAKNSRTGASSQSLLWNLYRRDVTPATKKCSLLFGLFQYQSGTNGRRLRLFYVPVMKSHQAPAETYNEKE